MYTLTSYKKTNVGSDSISDALVSFDLILMIMNFMKKHYLRYFLFFPLFSESFLNHLCHRLNPSKLSILTYNKTMDQEGTLMSFFLELQKNHSSTPVEKSIINYIINHPNEVIEMTMEDLARETYTSRSTISRFCKKNGYEGFNSLKMQLAIELNLFLKDEMSSSTSLLFEKGDNASSIIDNITSQDTYSIIETVRTNPVEHIEKLADKILNCRHVVFLGVQFSGIIAYDAHLRFSRLGIPCKYFNTECDILTYSYFADPQDVVIIFSYSGKTAVILEAADHIRGKGTFLASVTKNYNNELLEISDLHLYINSIDDPENNLSLSSRIAALCLVDMIYAVLVNKKSDNFYDKLMQTNKLYKKHFGN